MGGGGGGGGGSGDAHKEEGSPQHLVEELPELTRLMSMLAHHDAMPEVLVSCPEVLPLLLEFLHQVNVALLAPVRQLLRAGKPTRGLLSSLDPDDQLPWTLDYLTMLAGVADALCRTRDKREHAEFGSLLPAVDEAGWPLLQRYDLYNQLKLWSGHGAGGQTVRQAEEVERTILLKGIHRRRERDLAAQRLESGALRRMRYVHWAAAQLLCAGPVLPLHEARVEIEAELQWAAEGERAAPFALLRPMLAFHFDAMLPLFLLCTHTDDLLYAALFQVNPNPNPKP